MDESYIEILEQTADALTERLKEEREKLRRVILSLAISNGGDLFIPDVAFRRDQTFTVFRDEWEMGWRVQVKP